jgi:NDP-sugar pyrophosphorylase family protein
MYALILVGGRGERLRPLTDDAPKPMVLVCGKPILEHIVSWLKAGGIEDIMFLAGYRWQLVEKHFGDGAGHGFRAHYSIEDSPLGRGGAIKQGMARLPMSKEPVLVMNGDIITDVAINDLLSQHEKDSRSNPGHLATIMTTRFRSPYGIVDLNEAGMVTGFQEKPFLPFWINGGVYVFSRAMEGYLPEKGDHEDKFHDLAAAEALAAYRFEGYWRSIDSFKDLREAEDHLSGVLSP